MKEFMLKFDENGDGKIEMSEVNSHPFSLPKQWFEALQRDCSAEPPPEINGTPGGNIKRTMRAD